MRVFVTTVFLLLMISSCSLLSAQQLNNVSGWFTPHCDGAAFHLSKADGRSSQKTVNLLLRQPLTWWNYRPEEVWTPVAAERCMSSDKCETATRARIWLNKCAPNARRVSGKYEAEFGSEHLAGEFHLKYQKEKKLWICE